MRENQLPLHDSLAEETGRVRPAVDSGDGSVHIPRERVTHVEARPAGNYLADDSSNSVQITLAHFAAPKPASATSAVAFAQGSFLAPLEQNDDASDPELYSQSEESRDSKLETWLLASAVVSVTTLFTALYTIRNPDWFPSFVDQTVKISQQLSANIKRRASTFFGGTAVTGSAKAGAGKFGDAAAMHVTPTGRNSASAVQQKGETAVNDVTRNSVLQGVHPAAPASMMDVDRLAAQHNGSTGGAHQALASGRDETVMRENSRQLTKAKALSPKTGYMVPPPPPTPYVLPPGFGLLPMQPAQFAALQSQQAQAQALPKTQSQSAARENTAQQPTAALGRTEATQSDALVDADQELQSALNSSLRTVREWTR